MVASHLPAMQPGWVFLIFYNMICVQYAKLWLHSDIRSFGRQSVNAFTSRYDSTLLSHTFLHQKCFCMDIITFVRLIHIFSELLTHKLHIAVLVEVDQKIHQSVHLPFTM